MKKILLYLSAFLLASCVMVSCDDKPTPEPTPSAPKTGKEITSITVSPSKNAGLTSVCTAFLLFDTFDITVPVGYNIGQMVFDFNLPIPPAIRAILTAIKPFTLSPVA